MEANEAPEKIYLNPALDALTEALSEKTEDDIEYTRTDTFIEKACEWLSNVSIEDMLYKYNDFCNSESWYKFIEDFKKYMKGE